MENQYIYPSDKNVWCYLAANGEEMPTSEIVASLDISIRAFRSSVARLTALGLVSERRRSRRNPNGGAQEKLYAAVMPKGGVDHAAA